MKSELIFKIKTALFVFLISQTFISCMESNASNHLPQRAKTPKIFDEPVSKPVILNGESLIQLALLLDTSNSMDGLINQAKSQLWKIVNELGKAKYNGDPVKLEIALYEYGNDRLSSKEGYIRQVNSLINDLDKISENLFALSTNGGNEFCGHVIKNSLDQLEWSDNKDVLKLVYIAGNEPFNQGPVDFREECMKAKENGIFINSIFCGNHEEGIDTHWKDGALYGDGEYTSLQQDNATVYVKTPFDQKITSLNLQLNDTYLAYGAQGGYYIENQLRQDFNAESISEENKVERSISKSSAVYDNQNWDLVDKKKNSDFNIEEISEDALPAEMKGLSNEEKLEFIEVKGEERSQINIQIQELAKKREEFIKNKSYGNETLSLDQILIEAAKKKGVKLNYTFE